MAEANLQGYELLVCVTGGISAYKTASMVSGLVGREAGVTVAMTENATKLVGPPTFRALTGRGAHSDMWTQGISADIEHLSLPDKADLVVVAPATADILAKMAGGIADDLVSTTLLSAEGPVLLAPAMNVRMWMNPATQNNVSILQSRGHILVGPESGRQACGQVGPGRMAEPETIIEAIEKILGQRKPKSGT